MYVSDDHKVHHNSMSGNTAYLLFNHSPLIGAARDEKIDKVCCLRQIAQLPNSAKFNPHKEL